jgi:quinol monooxygenase YgiN
MIRHTVVFRLSHPEGSQEEAEFLATAGGLRSIPGISNFEALRQVGAKNDYRFGLSMEFADQAAYDAYDRHPDHLAFLQKRWIPEVTDFLEIDYVPYVPA